MRIDKINSSQKKLQETPIKHRRAFEAEEKLKKLAEQADLAKKLISSTSKENNNSSRTQGKSEDSKRSSATQNLVTKKKIQLVLQRVKQVQKKGLLTAQKRKLLLVGKKQANSTKTISIVLGTKVGFQRHLKRNQSLRIQQSISNLVDSKPRKIKSDKKIVAGNQNISKGESTKIKTPKKLQEVEVASSRSRSANSSTSRNIIPQNGK